MTDKQTLPAEAFGSTVGLGLPPERAAFEMDAYALGFDVTHARHKNPSGEPWFEYRDLCAGHRYGGFISAWEQQQRETERARTALRTARAYIARYGYTGELLSIIDAALGPNDGGNPQ